MSAQLLFSRPVSRQLTPADPGSAGSCCESGVSTLFRFDEWLRTIAGQLRRPNRQSGLEFAPGREMLRMACLPAFERQFIEYQLDVAKEYALGSTGESSTSSGAAIFHLRQIVSRIKTLLGQFSHCGSCHAKIRSPVPTIQYGGCELQIQDTGKEPGRSRS